MSMWSHAEHFKIHMQINGISLKPFCDKLRNGAGYLLITISVCLQLRLYGVLIKCFITLLKAEMEGGSGGEKYGNTHTHTQR